MDKKIWYNSLLLVICFFSLSACVSSNKKVSTIKAVNNYLDLARGYLKEEHLSSVKKPLDRVLELEPNSSEAYGLFALLYKKQQENVLAEKYFKKALQYKKDKLVTGIRNNYGAFLFQKKRYKEAYIQFNLASKDVNYPRRSYVFINLSMVFLKLKMQEMAYTSLEKALDINPNLPQVRYELSMLYYKYKKYGLAWLHFKKLELMVPMNRKMLTLGIELANINRDVKREAQYRAQIAQFNKTY